MSDKRGLDELIIIMRQPCNALVITLQLGVNSPSAVPPPILCVSYSIYLAILEAVKYLKIGL